MENLCAICGQSMKWINPGVSKTTGKPYNGFFACNDRTHKQPRVNPNQTQQPVYQIPQFKPPTAQISSNLTPKTPTVDWDSISRGKCKTLFLLEAYKLGKTIEESEKEAELWAEACMRKSYKTDDLGFNPSDIF